MEFGFAAAFSFCVVVLLLALRAATVPWPTKAALTLGSVAVVLAFHHALVATLGYPADARPQGVILVAGSDIREPGPDSAGVIYLWYVDADESRRPDSAQSRSSPQPEGFAAGSRGPGAPRAVRLPYDKATHQKLAQAAERARDGIATYMRFGGEAGDSPEGHGDADGERGAQSPERSGRFPRESRGVAAPGRLDFVLPPRTVPEKDGR